MRPVLEAWLAGVGLPAFLAPTYATMVGLAGLVGAAIVLHRTEREKDDVRGAATTLLFGYVAALVGGQLYELLRAAPEAIATGSLHPFLHTGRAAYGGLLFGTLAVLVHTRVRGASAAVLLDRIALALGAVFFLVRIGCFLAGCDYGVPTSSALGVSFPPGSLAALEEAEAGWIADGSASVPVHATQLYEGVLALVASGLAWAIYRRKPRVPDGAAFATFLGGYALARAAVEALRGDGGRGIYLGASSAQWTGLFVAIVAIAALAHAVRQRREARLAR